MYQLSIYLRIIFLFSTLLFHYSTLAQQKTRLHGIILSIQDEQPLSHASIGVKNKGVGTVSNHAGEFSLSIPASHQQDTLSVSYMGYQRFQMAISDVLPEQKLIIKLRQDRQVLNEILIETEKLPTASEIITRIRKSIKQNYPVKPYQLQAFFRQSKQVGGQYVSLQEAAVDIYAKNHQMTNKQFTNELFVIQEFRKSYDFYNKELNQLLSPPVNINPIKGVLLQNSVKYVKHNNILKLENADFQLDSIISSQGKEFYILSLQTPKKAKLYVDATNFALVKLEMFQDLSDFKTTIDQTFGDTLRAKLESQTFKIDFKEIEGVYYPFFLEFAIKSTLTDLRSNQVIYDQNTIQQLLVNNIFYTDVKFPGVKERTENVSFDQLKLDYNKDFWENYNIVKQTPAEKKVFEDLSKNVSLEQQFDNPTKAVIQPSGKELISQKALQKDFLKLRKLLEELHTGLFQYISKEQWNSFMDSTYQSLNREMTWKEFYKIIASTLAQIKNGHTIAEEPAWWFGQKQAFFPFQVKYIEKRFLIDQSLDDNLNIPKGSEILSINDLSAEKIREKVWGLIAADGYIETYKYHMLALFYAKYLSLIFDSNADFEIQYKTPNQEINTIRHPGIQMSYQQWHEYMMQNDMEAHEPTSLEINQDMKTAWLTIHHSHDFEKDLEQYFSSLQSQEIENLVIDLRGYLGLIEGCHSSVLYSYLTHQPFVFFEELRVQFNDYSVFDEDFTYRPYTNTLKEIKEGYFDKLTAKDDYFIWEGEPCLGLQEPSKYAFLGNVYVLVDGLNFSASTDFTTKASLLKNVNIIGEETGGAFRTFVSGFMPRLTLPNSKINIRIPTWQSFVDTDEMNAHAKGRGVLPDYEVSLTVEDYLDGRDTVKEFVERLIQKNR